MEKKRDPRKSPVASDIVERCNFAVSGQTLAEFAAVGRRKQLVSDSSIELWLEFLGAYPFLPVDQAYVSAGFDFALRYRIPYYDAALLAAAERLGAPVFYTEDLNHGQTYGSVRAVNPFL